MIGNKPTISECDDLRYQPFKFWSYQNNQCEFFKSSCNEIGQIVFDLGKPHADSSCRCDYTQGYAFLATPENQCYCTPSKEDCTCFLKTCPSNYTLMSGMNYILS